MPRMFCGTVKKPCSFKNAAEDDALLLALAEDEEADAADEDDAEAEDDALELKACLNRL